MKKPSRRPRAKRRAPARDRTKDVTQVVANAPVLLFELDARGVITLLAGGLAEKLGLKPANAVGRGILDMHKGIPRAPELVQRALAGEIFCTTVHLKGRVLEMCFSPRRDRQGRPAGVTGWATDVTEHKQAEEKYRAIFSGTNEGILVAVPSEKRFKFANPAACAMFGYSEEELLRLGVADIHPEEALPRVLAAFAAQARQEVVLTPDVPCLRKDGSVFFADIKAGPVVIEGQPYIAGFFTDVTARRQSEEALRQKSAFLESLIESIRDGVSVIDRRGVRVLTNRAFCEMTGFSKTELQNSAPPFPVWPPEHLANIQAAFAKLMRGELRDAELVFMRKDGTRFPVLLSASYRRDEKGDIQDFIAMIKDISGRKRADEERRATEERFRTIFDAEPECVKIVSPEGTLEAMNPAGLRMLEVDRPEDAIGRPIFDWIVPEWHERMKSRLSSLLQGTPFKAEFEIVGRKGTRRWMETHAVPMRDAGSRIVSMLAVTRDITERKRAEAEKKVSASLLQATLESTADGILVVDRKGRVTSHNQRFLRIWSIPESLAATRDDSKLLGFVLDQLSDPDQFLSKVQELYSQPEAESFDALNFKDGRVIERYSQPQKLDGKVVGRVWSFRDISQRVRAEAEKSRLLESERAARAEAEAASKAKDDFLAIVSHELRTPLTAVMGWSWLLRSGKLSDDERQNALDVILRNMQSQRQIVEDLIDVSSLSRGLFSLSRKPMELAAVLEADCESLGQLARSRRIRVLREVRGPVGVEGDAGRLQQVFSNILNNALKFTPDGGDIRVSLRQEGGQAVVEVQDSGKGIPSDFLPHVFDPFRQGENPLTREHGGLGLGLAIVKRLVELHGGTVLAASAGKGRGSVFTVRLPAIPWPPPGHAAAQPRALPADLILEGVKILVVEDEADARQLLEQLLSRYGARVATAADAAQALASLEAEVPDLLLCDIALPGEDGCSLLRRVRGRGGLLGSVPAAALTALAREEDRLRALQAGFQLYLTKPADPAQILEAIRMIVGRR